MNPSNPTNSINPLTALGEAYAIIMAGGSGERFWPLSTPDRPKQFLRLLDDRSLLQKTVDRVAGLIPIEKQIVVAGKQHADRIREELPNLPAANLICEPVGRNTAACIGLASLFLERRDPSAIAVVLPADHHIPDQSLFLSAIEKAIGVARELDVTVVIGIRPDRPETGYGYMKRGKEVGQDVYKILSFHEKPDEAIARDYLAAKDYFWNSGIFVWQNRTIQHLIKIHLPSHWERLQEIRSRLGKPTYDEVLAKNYPTLGKVSIDYGVLEKTEDIHMVTGQFRWDDLGSWTALDRIQRNDEKNNVVIGRHVGLDTANCIIYGQGGKVIATIGLRDLIIAETEHGLLICPKTKAQEIRKLLTAISKDETPDS